MRLVVTLLAIGAALVSVVASRQQSLPAARVAPPLITTPAGSAAVEQTTPGTRPPEGASSYSSRIGAFRLPGCGYLSETDGHLTNMYGRTRRTAMAHDGHDDPMNTKGTPGPIVNIVSSWASC